MDRARLSGECRSRLPVDSRADEMEQYWMLCHNCDKWHLPTPCTEPFKQCGRCGNMGHLDYFCAADPKPRPPPGQKAVAGNGNGTAANKPCAQPHFPPGMQFPVTDAKYCNPHFIALLQAKAVTDAMGMLNSGLPMQHVISHFWPPGTRPTLQIPRVLAPAQTTSMPSAPLPAAGQPGQLPQPMQLQHHHTMPQKSVEVIDMGSPDSEPAAKRRRSSTIEGHSQGDPAVQEGATEQTSNIEDNQTIAVSATVSPETHPAEGSFETATPGKSSKKGTVSKRKASSGTRCSDCIRQHKKCKHNGNDGQQSREQSVSAPEYTHGEREIFHAQASAGMQAPGQVSANSNDDVFGGNTQMAGFDARQQYPDAIGHIQPLQPHEHAELQKILAVSQAAGTGATATAEGNEGSHFEQINQVNWAGGAVQQHFGPTAGTAEDQAMDTATTKPVPKKRGGGRKKT
ncbi:hypothetical protein HII31_09073 [Pseudocercospora fuligena]|uniref:Uncharacterized protein n=1 Tax=Pseudocercospora fuligena TaxID=685502 RepID=A0A8H6VIU4_9PEZI|nr:hypothetical protein HII31_09073 [Pseudocercospora fuligena]